MSTFNKLAEMLDGMEQSLTEAPYGKFQQGWNKFKTKLGGDIGAHAQGSLAIGNKVNKLHGALMQWMGFNGIDSSSLTQGNVIEFLEEKGMTDASFSRIKDSVDQPLTDWRDSDSIVTKNELYDVLKSAVRVTQKKVHPSQQSQTAAQPSAQPQSAPAQQPAAQDWNQWASSLTPEQQKEALKTLQRMAGIPSANP